MRYTLSVPSWVIPGTWAENLRHIEPDPRIGGMELLLYLWDNSVRQDFNKELPIFLEYAKKLHLSIHLPEADSETIREIVDATCTFAKTYCIHPPKAPEAKSAFAKNLCELRQKHGNIFFLENTRMEFFEKSYTVLTQASHDPNWPVCMDTAHLLKEGNSVAQFIENYGHAIRQVHLNDQKNGKDHVPLTHSSLWLNDCIHFICSFSGLLELEVFSMQDIETSLDALTHFLMEGA